MLRRICLSTLTFSINKTPLKPSSAPSQLKSLDKQNYGSLGAITKQRRNISIETRNKFLQNQLTPQLKLSDEHQLCQVTLYMKHDEWKSQYMYALMNYQQMGFTRVSDYVFLKDMAKFLGIQKKGDGEIWPVAKFKMPLQENQFLIGIKDICDFIDKKHLFLYDVEDNDTLAPAVEKYIDENIAPHLEYLFWHPRLTFEQIFHVNLSSFSRVNMNYKLVEIFLKLYTKTFFKIIGNLYKIVTNREKYGKSKENLEKGFKEITRMLNGKDFIGGQKPSHLDFYLFAILSTKTSSRHFQQYLKSIGGEFWAWFFRMQRATRYEKDRITLV